jgi:exopolyphosphatase/guanosine-5'-triphosphate,3'-diphosphate pyrophosphatase
MPRKKYPEKVAIIDIGSNSVRMVIFRFTKRGYKIACEKKAICGLARDMTHDRPRLDRKGIALTLKTLRKFRRCIVKQKVRKVLAIGTAAMRATVSKKQGRVFHRQAERALGSRIAVISGIKEARLTARGVMSGLPKVLGVCGDLGGGSLELAAINRGRVNHTATLPLGSLTIRNESKGDPLEAEALMRARLADLPWLGRHRDQVFYPIGGSWRAVARVMMKMRGQKIRRVHGYTIDAGIARRLVAGIARQNPARFRGMHKKIRHRAEIIPYAAAVLYEIIIRMHPAHITFSAHGVREGLFLAYSKT